MRIILFTGKGGVGKTTIAAATALKAAREGCKTLILSTDPAHSLADALGQELGPEPQEIAPFLFAQELDVYYSMKKHWGNVKELMQTVMRWQGVENIVAEELSALPGMEEGSAFLWLEEYYREKAYDLIIVDSAPTGETLTLLSLPQVTQSWVMRAFPGQKLAMRGFGTMVRTMTGIPLDKGLGELDELFQKLERIQKVMHNPEICSIRIVLNPERMVVNEAKRAYTYLQLFGYHVDAVIVNRIFPEELADGPFSHYIEKQKEYLLEIEDSFAHLPVLKAGHQGREVFGQELLGEIASSVYAEKDPAAIFHHDKPMEIVEKGKGFLIRLKLPFTNGQEPEVKKFGEELIITLGNQRRTIFLPRFANYLQLQSSEWKDDQLEIMLSK
jgi:arsenite-transporting ATPase